MKISLKIFIFTYCIMMSVTVLGGFWLINSEYRDSLKQAKQIATDNNRSLYNYITTIDEVLGDDTTEYSLARFIQQMSQEKQNEIFIGNYKEIKAQISEEPIYNLATGEYGCSIVLRENQTQIRVVSRYKQQYVVNYHDISDILTRRDQNYILYRNIIIGTSVVIAAVLYLFSWYITRPLSKVTRMAEKLSDGEYDVRIESSYKKMKSYEVEQLGNTLNHMAAHTENYIEDLKENARRKDDFVGNFTHEIKTPMTSIIGYADLLRTYDLEPDKRREYSNYIYKEGKRVEQLALNLLQLIVMQKTDFTLEPIEATELMKQLEADVRFLGKKYDVKIRLKYERGIILGEKSLLLVTLKNLIDNACKASKSGADVLIEGEKRGDKYYFFVRDRGYGIPEGELEHVLEPFYMVDKSRARTQGGAGIGLSLCSKIIQIHRGEMQIESEFQKGTTVIVRLNCWEGGGANDEENVSTE